MKNFKAITLLALMIGLFQSQDLTAQFAGQKVNFKLSRYNSANSGMKLPVEEEDILATIHLRGWTPANEFQTSSAIRSTVTGNVNAGILPARLDFHNGQSDLFDMRRITILNNGNVGIGFPQMYDPITLFDVNGDARIRGASLFLDDPSEAAGGEALTRIGADCLGAPLPNANGLALNFGGGFTDGVFVDGPGLEVCGDLESDCLTADGNIASRSGNIYALGDEVVPDPCTLPNDGDFVALGNNSDFIAQHGNFVADEGNITATLGDVTAGQNITAQNGDIVATVGNVTAGQNITSLNGDLTALNGNVSASFNVSAGQNVSATQDINAGANLSAGGDFSANGDATVGGNVRIGSIVGDPSGHRLAVGGSVVCEEVSVKLQADWPDYVFSNQYPLLTLQEVEKYIAENSHLPGIPSADNVARNGLSIGHMQLKMMEKLEELYLHVIELNHKVQTLENENNRLKAEKQ